MRSESATMRSENAAASFINKLFSVKETGVILITAGFFIVLSIINSSFLSSSNIVSILVMSSFVGIMATGESLTIITAGGGIDLSVSSTLGLTGVIIGTLVANYHWNDFLALIPAIGVSILIGLSNGLIITKLKMAPFIVTLGTLSVGEGLSYVISGGWPLSGFSNAFIFNGLGSLWAIPMPIIYMLIVGVAMYLFLHKSLTGRRLLSIGGNREASKLMGIKIDRIIILAYTLSGFTAGIAGFLMTAWLGVAQPNAGSGYNLTAIAAAVIGGTSLTGGEGSIIGCIVGAILLSTITNGLVLLKVSSFWQEVATGVIIILAILFDEFSKRWRLRGV
ncbi:MAG: ABC transporter permease [Nitrososphaeria archaeon]